jgi:hypothetical protein
MFCAPSRKADAALLERIFDISCESAPMEKDARILMTAEQRRGCVRLQTRPRDGCGAGQEDEE